MNMHDVSELTFMDFSVFKPLFLFQKLIIFETIIIISWQLVLLTNSWSLFYLNPSNYSRNQTILQTSIVKCSVTEPRKSMTSSFMNDAFESNQRSKLLPCNSYYYELLGNIELIIM